MRGLRSHLAAANADHAVRAIVIAGNERDFCTGADVTASRRHPTPGRPPAS